MGSTQNAADILSPSACPKAAELDAVWAVTEGRAPMVLSSSPAIYGGGAKRAARQKLSMNFTGAAGVFVGFNHICASVSTSLSWRHSISFVGYRSKNAFLSVLLIRTAYIVSPFSIVNVLARVVISVTRFIVAKINRHH